MIFYYFLDDDWGAVMTQFGILTTIAVIITIAVGIDLYFGIMESRKKNMYTHSNGLRMTIQKLIMYLSILFLAFLIDAVNPTFIYFFDNLPHLPLGSIGVAVFILITEFISVKEHASEGTRKKMRNTPKEVKDMLAEIKELAKEIKEIRK